jgi:hypothetical protein
MFLISKMLVSLRRGISFVFLKYIINEYNPPIRSFTVPNEHCTYMFRLLQSNHHQAVGQKFKEVINLHIASGRELGLIKVVTYVFVTCRKGFRI